MRAKCQYCHDLDVITPYLSISTAYFLYFTQILGSVAKGCPLLEYIDLQVVWIENSLHIDVLTALASLRHLRSVFIEMYDSVESRTMMTPQEKEGLRVSLEAIVDQGLLEVVFYLQILCNILLPQQQKKVVFIRRNSNPPAFGR